jgi:DNA-binding response OmpR family regulator
LTDHQDEGDKTAALELGIISRVTLRVLAVDDDRRILDALALALNEENYSVVGVESGEAAVDEFRQDRFDIVLLDLMLPGMTGFDVCRELRRTSDVPIVMLTAKTDTHDVVAGLECGADDYVTKPFEVKELAARLRALLRRVRPSSRPEGVVVGALEVIPDAGIVRLDGDDIALTRTEFRLLCELVEHQNVILSREQLLERVWGYDYFGDSRLVDAHIRRLRTKIEIDPANPEFVVTVRGLGYKFVA